MTNGAMHRGTLIIALVMIGTLTGFTQQQSEAPAESDANSPPQMRIRPDRLPKPTLNDTYEQRLEAEGGTPPFTWVLAQGELPPGITLDPAGALRGTPNRVGDYTFTIAVKDAGEPPHEARHEFRVAVTHSLEFAWKTEPHVEGSTIVGVAEVKNEGEDPFDLTFIVLAVNDYGKAFALGYQRLTLNPDNTHRIDFSSNVPDGTYKVHADAVGEVASRNVIRRAWVESVAPLVVSSQP
jgi:hypothetical protein